MPSGYEDLIAAGKLVTGSKPLQDAVLPGATLQQKRLAMIDDTVYQGLQTLRAWLNRPDRVDRLGALSDLPLETMSLVRTLARALAIEQYVFLATGRVGAAIASARDGLRMSYAIKPNTLVVWLVSDAVDVTVTRTIAQHFDQLSQKDCENLTDLAKDWLSSPDPTATMLEVERRQALGGLKAALGQGQHVAEGALPAPVDAPPELKNLNQTDREALQNQVVARLDQMYTAFRADLNRPLWERLQTTPKPTTVDTKLPLADQMATNLFSLVQPVLQQMLERRGKQQARARMVGCHAAIRNYRWEHDRLPASLDELKLGDMAIDPFTGEPFIFQPTADKRGYILQSAGPPSRDENGKIKSGEHQPFGLIP